MKIRIPLLSLALLGLLNLGILRGAEPFALQPGTQIRWADREQAASLLQTSDTFTESLSPFDRKVRIGSATDPGEEAFRSYISQQVQAWTQTEIDRQRDAWGRVKERLENYTIPLPETVWMVKTNGKEEPAPYTRQNAIILPQRAVASPRPPDGLLIHELFHVASRNNAELRQALYAIIGFQPCGPRKLPTSLQPRRVTNPDSPVYDFDIEVEYKGKTQPAIPILLTQQPDYDPADGKPFFNYLEQKLWLIEAPTKAPKLVDFADATNFFDQIGGKNFSVFQPEEILAAQITNLLMDRTPPSQESLADKLAQELQ